MTINLRADQMPPKWTIWGIAAPRGWGATTAALAHLNTHLVENVGHRGLIVVPTEDDIDHTIEKLKRINSNIVYLPGIKRVIWTSGNSESFRRLEDARDIVVRLSDLRPSNPVYQAAKKHYDDILLDIKNEASTAFVAFADDDEENRLRGLQAHVAVANDIHTWPQRSSITGGIPVLDQVRLATRLGDNPQVVVTHDPDFTQPYLDMIYTKA